MSHHQIVAQANVLVHPSPVKTLPPNGTSQAQELAVLPPPAEHIISIKHVEEEEVKVHHDKDRTRQNEHHHSPAGSTRSSDASSREEDVSDLASSSSSNLSLPTKVTRVHSLGQGQGLLLPNYDALLNPFDPVEHADMSADFLHELQRLFTKKPTAKVPLLVPATERDPVTEESIAKRLTEHLQMRYLLIKKKRSTLLRGMIIWLLIGFTALYASTLIADDTVYEGLLWNLVRLVIDPVGWWACWTGMDNAATYRRHRKRVNKAAALAQLEFVFTDYQVPAAK